MVDISQHNKQGGNSKVQHDADRTCAEAQRSSPNLRRYRSMSQSVPRPYSVSLTSHRKSFERLSGGQVFSKLYIPDAYLEVELYNESKRHVVKITHRGLYQYNPLCFGLSSAPAIFQ